MGRSKKSLKLFVEFNNLKLVYISKKDQVVGRLLKRLEKSFYESFNLEDQPVFDKVTEKNFTVSLFDLVGDVFENNSCIEVVSRLKKSSLVDFQHGGHEKILKSMKRESSRDLESKPKDMKLVKEVKDLKDLKELKESKEIKELKENKFDVAARNMMKGEVLGKDLKNVGKRNEEKKIDLKEEEKKDGKGESVKDSKSENSAKKQKAQGGKGEYKVKVEDEKKGASIENLKKDNLKTSSESEVESEVLNKDEKKSTLIKSNIFRN